MATKYQYATGTGAMAVTLAPGVKFRLEEVRLHIDAAVVEVENFTITMDADEDAVHDTVILTQAMATLADFVNQPTRPQEFEASDELDFAFTNTDANTWGLTIIFS